MSHGYLKSIFDVFDKYKCAVDMVSTSEVSVSVTVDSNEKLPEISAELGKLADVKYEGRKALICMVGEDIRGQNGIAAQVFQAIRHINVRMISQGASEINMSFMIEEDDVDEAVRSLHAAFFRDPDPEVFDIEARDRELRQSSRLKKVRARERCFFWCWAWKNGQSGSGRGARARPWCPGTGRRGESGGPRR